MEMRGVEGAEAGGHVFWGQFGRSPLLIQWLASAGVRPSTVPSALAVAIFQHG